MKILKKIKLDGVGVVVNFVCRRILPCKERFIPTYEYAGDDDITQEAPKKLEKGNTYARL